jgi:hypothetical protein
MLHASMQGLTDLSGPTQGRKFEPDPRKNPPGPVMGGRSGRLAGGVWVSGCTGAPLRTRSTAPSITRDVNDVGVFRREQTV